MSSVIRFIKQTPSAYFWSHGADTWTYETIVNVFNGTTGNYSGPVPKYNSNIILFDTEQHCYDATNELFNNVGNDYYFDGYNTVQDLGKRIYIGVSNIDSQMFTLSFGRARDDGLGNMVLFYRSPGTTTQDAQNIITNNAIGTVDYAAGKINIKNLNITGLADIDFEITIKPSSNDVISAYTQIAQIAVDHLSVTAIPDKTANGDLRAGTNYTFTTSRS